MPVSTEAGRCLQGESSVCVSQERNASPASLSPAARMPKVNLFSANKNCIKRTLEQAFLTRQKFQIQFRAHSCWEHSRPPHPADSGPLELLAERGSSVQDWTINTPHSHSRTSLSSLPAIYIPASRLSNACGHICMHMHAHINPIPCSVSLIYI